MLQYDNEKESLITVDGIQYLAVEDRRLTGHFCVGCVFNDPVLRLLVGTNKCISVPCCAHQRKDLKNVILVEVADA